MKHKTKLEVKVPFSQAELKLIQKLCERHYTENFGVLPRTETARRTLNNCLAIARWKISKSELLWRTTEKLN